MRPAECGVGHISRPEDVRAGEVPHCRVECVVDGQSIRLRVQSGPSGWVYTERCERSPSGYTEAWQGASYALRFWWANNRDIWIERETWEQVAWRLRGLEEVMA